MWCKHKNAAWEPSPSLHNQTRRISLPGFVPTRLRRAEQNTGNENVLEPEINMYQARRRNSLPVQKAVLQHTDVDLICEKHGCCVLMIEKAGAHSSKLATPPLQIPEIQKALETPNTLVNPINLDADVQPCLGEKSSSRTRKPSDSPSIEIIRTEKVRLKKTPSSKKPCGYNLGDVAYACELDSAGNSQPEFASTSAGAPMLPSAARYESLSMSSRRKGLLSLLHSTSTSSKSLGLITEDSQRSETRQSHKRRASPLKDRQAKQVRADLVSTRSVYTEPLGNAVLWSIPQHESFHDATMNGEQTASALRAEAETSPFDQRPTTLSKKFKPKRWTARSWTASQYAALAQTCESSFPFSSFETLHNKSRAEVVEVFSAVIQMPLLAHSGRGLGAARGGLGEERVKERRGKEREMSRYQARLKHLQIENEEEERRSLRQEVEKEVWEKLKTEGINHITTPIPEHDITRYGDSYKGKNFKRESTTKGRKMIKTKTVDEATAELQAASTELICAKKAEERRVRKVERKERRGNGETGRKIGRPRKQNEGVDGKYVETNTRNTRVLLPASSEQIASEHDFL